MAPPSQELEPPINPGRFTEDDNRQQCNAAELLDGLHLICGRRDTVFRSGDEGFDCIAQPSGKYGVVNRKAATFLCGFGFDQSRGDNARIARCITAQLVEWAAQRE